MTLNFTSAALRLKEFFHSSDNNNNNLISSQSPSPTNQIHIKPISKPSTSNWTPPSGRNHSLDLYINTFRKHSQAHILKVKHKSFDNLKPNERSAIKTLKMNQDIVIKPADKGGATVILNKSDYITEGNRQLKNKENYSSLSGDPTKHFTEELKKLIKSFPDPYKTQLLSYIPPNPQPGKFYLLPKIHKPNNPGRPIVSNLHTLTEHLSHFVEVFLKPYVLITPSFIKDTTDFLNKLNNIHHIPDNTFLVTLDVSSLYTNITHKKGLQALKNTLPDDQLTHIILSLTEFILNHNYFIFEDQTYLQLKGTAMGTRMAPQYANIFMSDLEQKFLEKSQYKPISYLRYIDDIFFLWTHGEDKLIDFHNQFNLENQDIKLTIKYSNHEISFLDTNIKLLNNTLATSIYRKPTQSQSYLHPTSSHPPHTFNSIVYSQALRLNRICSCPKDLNLQLDILRKAFTILGYKSSSIRRHIDKALSFSRDTLLQYKPKLKSDRTPLVLTYHPNLKPIHKIVQNLQHFFKTDPHLDTIFPLPPLISYRQPPNLRLLLTSDSSTINKKSFTTGTFPCNSSKCCLCPNIDSRSSITGPNGVSFKISGNFNCNSQNVIYAITCNICPQAVYIGETSNSIRQRMNGHRNDIKHNRKKPVADHFNQSNHSIGNLLVAVLKQVRGSTKQQREIEEQKIILKFDCVRLGLNKDYSFMAHYL